MIRVPWGTAPAAAADGAGFARGAEGAAAAGLREKLVLSQSSGIPPDGCAGAAMDPGAAGGLTGRAGAAGAAETGGTGGAPGACLRPKVVLSQSSGMTDPVGALRGGGGAEKWSLTPGV